MGCNCTGIDFQLPTLVLVYSLIFLPIFYTLLSRTEMLSSFFLSILAQRVSLGDGTVWAVVLEYRIAVLRVLFSDEIRI